MDNKRLLVICGPTATGKTRLAIQLAKRFGGEMVSADSRQVYKGMDIGTGKELPENHNFHRKEKIGFYEIRGVKIWGYDLVNPKNDFSVTNYIRVVSKIIIRIQKESKLPILVGGTGLYIKAIVDGIPTATIPKNEGLRENLKNKTTEELFEILAEIDPIRAGSLNYSDKKNPRRLVRAVEIATWKIDKKDVVNKSKKQIPPKDVLFIGLTAPKDELNRRIEKRVDKRVKDGIEEEIGKLIKMGLSWDGQAMSSLGYRQWKDYFERRKSKKEVIMAWKAEEKKYAKRQITWFKKDKRVNWFDITGNKYQKKVEKLVEKWYKSIRYAEKS